MKGARYGIIFAVFGMIMKAGTMYELWPTQTPKYPMSKGFDKYYPSTFDCNRPEEGVANY